jgi:hypothetical protein
VARGDGSDGSPVFFGLRDQPRVDSHYRGMTRISNPRPLPRSHVRAPGASVPSSLRLVRLVLAALALCVAGGCDGDDDVGECPDLRGAWVVTSHCEGDLVGSTLTVLQNGCDLEIPEYDLLGSVDDTGGFTAGGTVNGQVMICEGFANETRITETCNDVCDVILARP